MQHEKRKSNEFSGQPNVKDDEHVGGEVNNLAFQTISQLITPCLRCLLTDDVLLDRERNETLNTHLDGMSSDDEVPDHESTVYKNHLSKPWIKPI